MIKITAHFPSGEKYDYNSWTWMPKIGEPFYLFDPNSYNYGQVIIVEISGDKSECWLELY